MATLISKKTKVKYLRSKSNKNRRTRSKPLRSSRRTKRSSRRTKRSSRRTKRSSRRTKRSSRRTKRSSRRTKRMPRKIVENLNELDKIFGKLDKFPGMSVNIASFLSDVELRQILNREEYAKKAVEIQDLLDTNRDLLQAIAANKKKISKIDIQMSRIRKYMLTGILPPKASRSYIKLLSSRS